MLLAVSDMLLDPAYRTTSQKNKYKTIKHTQRSYRNMIGSPFYNDWITVLYWKPRVSAAESTFGPLSSRDLSINDAIISPDRPIVRSPSRLPCWNYRMRWLMVTGCLLWLTLINHHSWFLTISTAILFCWRLILWWMEHGHSNHLQKLQCQVFFRVKFHCLPFVLILILDPLDEILVNINFSDVGSCRSSATSDLQFAGFVSKKSPRKRWTLLFLGCKRQPLPKQSTKTMIRHVLELLDLTGLRRNIRKINSKAKPSIRHQSLLKTPGFSSSTSLTKKHVEFIGLQRVWRVFQHFSTGSQWVNVAFRADQQSHQKVVIRNNGSTSN